MQKTIKFMALSLIVSLSMGCSQGATESNYLKRQWVSSEGELSIPESVIYDANQQSLYVSNVNSQNSGNPWTDNDGFISKLDSKGKIMVREWIKGLKAPKGLSVNGEHLYVSDLDAVVDINTTSGSIIQRMQAPKGVEQLNDIAYDTKQALLYVSDSKTKAIYRVTPQGIFTLLYPSEKTDKPEQNGLFVDNNTLIMQGTVGYLKALNLNDGKNVQTISDSVGIAIDGITRYGDKGYLISTWGGEIHFVDNEGKAKLLLDSKPNRTADITYVPELNLLLVPNFDKNIVAYEVKEL